MRKLYLFTNTKGDGHSGWENCLAMADDGAVLASHLCSHVGFMEGDLITGRPERKEMYEEHFGGARDVVFEAAVLAPGELPPDDVIDKNAAMQLSEATNG